MHLFIDKYVVIGSGSNSRPHENCGITDNPAYETYTGELGVDRLEHDYNMDNNPLYMMTNKPTTETNTSLHVYDVVIS